MLNHFTDLQVAGLPASQPHEMGAQLDLMVSLRYRPPGNSLLASNYSREVYLEYNVNYLISVNNVNLISCKTWKRALIVTNAM